MLKKAEGKMKIEISEHFDYKKLLRFTLPSIGMMMFSAAFSVIDDGFFVSNFVGKDAFVALNLMSPIITVIGAIGYMLGTGGNAVISKVLGEQEPDKANEYFSLLTYFTVAVSFLLSVIGLAALKPFCIAIGAEGVVLENCLTYGWLILPFAVFFLLQGIFQSFLITAGNPKLAMIVTCVSGASNIVFDVLLIVVLKLGIVGTVLATLSGAVLSTVIPVLYFAMAKNRNLRFVKAKMSWQVLSRTCVNGASELVTNLSMGLTTVLYNYQLMRISGNNGVAAYGAIMYIAYIFQSAFMGYSMGVAPVIGYNHGAKNDDELKNVFAKSLVVLGVMSIVLFLAAELTAVPFSGVFVRSDKELWNMTVHGFRIFSVMFLFSGLNIFGSGFFTALDDGLISGVLALTRTLVLQIITVFVLPLLFKLDGVWLASPVADVIMLGVTIFMFAKMRKKYRYC